MFDYQAGEKYKLTLIMVALAGLMAGMFFTVLLMPTPEASGPRRRQQPKWASNPDGHGGIINSQNRNGAPQDSQGQGDPRGAEAQGQQGANSQSKVDPLQARELLDQQFLPLAWDLSAASSRSSQAKAISYMTEDCKRAYINNIWTNSIAKQIEESGVQSHFSTKKMDSGSVKSDGSVEITVEGQQTLSVPGKGGRTRDVKVVYLVKQFPDGMKIAGISEAGQTQ